MSEKLPTLTVSDIRRSGAALNQPVYVFIPGAGAARVVEAEQRIYGVELYVTPATCDHLVPFGECVITGCQGNANVHPIER